MERREILSRLGPGIGLLAGCSNNNSPGTDEVTHRSSQMSNTSTASPETPTPRAFLPESEGGWVLTGTSDYAWDSLGGSDGIIGRYEGPDGAVYEMVVMRDEDNAEGSVGSFVCAGWQIALAYRGFAIAASSGTEQGTLTPEAPPTMSSTPAEGRLEKVYELLVRSPRLTDTEVPDRSECPYETDTPS